MESGNNRIFGILNQINKQTNEKKNKNLESEENVDIIDVQ